MTTWPSLHACLTRLYPVEVDDGEMLVLRVVEQNSHLVFVTFHEGTNAGSWVRLEAEFGELTSRVAATGLQHVGLDDNLGLGLGRMGEFVTIRWTAFLEDSADERIATMVAAAAWHAERLTVFLETG